VEEFEFNPRDLIAGPFQTCPECEEPCFGVLMISGDAYFRRCAACFHSVRFALPALRKKVIYLDQFAISNLVKALDPRSRGHARVTADPFWVKLFETLEVASKMQIVICPDSDEHRTESLVAPFYPHLKRIYEHFSYGVSFQESRTIRRIQLVEMAKRWLDGDTTECTLDPSLVTSGDLHSWQSPIRVSVTSHYGDEILRAIRATREQVHQEMQITFEYWRSEKLSFDDRLAREGGEYGGKLLLRLVEWRASLREAQFGLNPFDPGDLNPPPAAKILTALIAAFRTRGLPENEAVNKAVEFLSSDVPTASPHRHLFGLLYASLAMRAQNGQTSAPNRGMANDIRTIADLLPYCDAMFVDNGARALLNDIPKNRKPRYGCKVFSPNVGTEFLDYLEQLIIDAPEEHRALVKHVYGDDYTNPYGGILLNNS
jgi:hypothetical protein